MQATPARYKARIAGPRARSRLARARATLVALGAALLAMVGIHEH
jgi:hypothetical protein